MRSDPIQLVTLGAVALCVAVGAILVFRRFPRLAVAVWVAFLFFTPVWLGGQVGGLTVTALTAVTVLVIVSCLGPGFEWSLVDTMVLALFVSLFAAMLIGGTPWALVQSTLTAWLLPYILGRIVLLRSSESWVGDCIAAAAVVAAGLVIVEFLTGRNVFLSIPGAQSSIWGTLQVRGGLLRAEGAFGHSIAMGASLAMSSAFVLSARWPVWLRTAALGVVGVATGMTLSRIGLIGLVLSVLLAIVFLRLRIQVSMRVTAGAILVALAVAGLPLVNQVFGEAGSEAEGSAEYRSDLLPLLDQMQLLGISPSREVLATGEDYFGGFRSIDSALILLGLRFGMVPLLIAVAILVIAVFAVLVGRGSPAAVALVAQIPAFATVALITQYAGFVWFVGGLSVASYSLYRRDRAPQDVRHPGSSFRELTGVT